MSAKFPSPSPFPSPDSPFVDLTAMIRQRAAQHGARAAIVCDDETLTFAALQSMIDRCAAAQPDWQGAQTRVTGAL